MELKQVCQKAGRIEVLETPQPDIPDLGLLVKTSFSCISAGTELAGLGYAEMPMWKKALKNPDKIQKALKMMQERGLQETWRKAKGELAPPTALGYSASGIVVGVGERVEGFCVGDPVACAGAGFASHAEYISIPVNLAVPVPAHVGLEEASTVAIGGIAMQALRRASPQLGETVVVVGLGLIGNLLVQFAKAAGLRVIAVDTDEIRLSWAKLAGADFCLNTTGDALLNDCRHKTGLRGVDVVFVTAGTQNKQLVNTAVELCRRKGKVIVVGDAKIDLDREPLYKREADVLISTSYGPGRYDPDYEILGNDYPFDYVRWTENRNMASYLALIDEGKVDLHLDEIARIRTVNEAPQLYEEMKPEAEDRPLFGLFSYDEDKPSHTSESTKITDVQRIEKIGVGLIGAGEFAQGIHLPKLCDHNDCDLVALATRQPAVAAGLAQSYKIKDVYVDPNELINNPAVHLVYITTRHDSHGKLVLSALRAGKHVFVEKPLTLDQDEFLEIREEFEKRPDQVLFIGFNRRFARSTVALVNALKERQNPLMISYRMNALALPQNHWTRGPMGGGRNLGEGCHIYDFFQSVIGCPAINVQSMTIGGTLADKAMKQENFSTQIRYEDGSVANLIYTSLGHKNLDKEKAEIFADGHVYDFGYDKVMDLASGAILWQGDLDKGHGDMIDRLMTFVKDPSKGRDICRQQVANMETTLYAEKEFWRPVQN